MVKVNLYATLRQMAGNKTVEIDVAEAATLRQLIASLAAHYPALRARLLDENGEVQQHVHVFVNGRDMAFLPSKIDTVIKPDDAVNIFPPVGGG